MTKQIELLHLYKDAVEQECEITGERGQTSIFPYDLLRMDNVGNIGSLEYPTIFNIGDIVK